MLLALEGIDLATKGHGMKGCRKERCHLQPGRKDAISSQRLPSAVLPSPQGPQGWKDLTTISIDCDFVATENKINRPSHSGKPRGSVQ